MDNDDRLVGRVLSRREVFRVITGGSAAAALAPALLRAAGGGPAGSGIIPACVVHPEVTEGPYFVDLRLNRSDIRADAGSREMRAGVPLALTFNVVRIGEGGCRPLPGATVDVWQCDAEGLYSGVNDPGYGDATTALNFLRGYQTTNADGRAAFTTIYPGWYRGRAVHVHFKIRATAPTGDAYEFTSQLFFDDALTDRVHSGAPYAARGRRDRRNDADTIYREAGPQLLLAAAPAGDGYAATFDVGLDLTDAAVGRADGGGGRGGRGPGRSGAGRRG